MYDAFEKKSQFNMIENLKRLRVLQVVWEGNLLKEFFCLFKLRSIILKVLQKNLRGKSEKKYTLCTKYFLGEYALAN